IATVCPMDWVLLTYRLPTEPSRHRVAVWRALRRVGAISAQQAIWAVPAQDHLIEAIEQIVQLIERADGEVLVFDAAPRDDEMAARLESLFTKEREEEWTEFLSECVKFDEEIAKEIRIKKFTAAELDEEEQNLDRLRRWCRELQTRDIFGAPSRPDAERHLK